MSNDCIFCKIVKREIPSEKIYENDNFISIPDAHPVLEGHTLVISKKHFDTTLDLPSSLGQEFLDCIKNTALILIKKYDAEGINIINNVNEVAGQVVKHFHFHIVPRKKNDGKKLEFSEGE